MDEAYLYEGREQTLVKHLILRKYLERFAHIIGFGHWNSITYVDCFSGPWNVRSDELKDSSFSIALEELRRARETHSIRGKTLNLRCFFLEKDPSAYARLKTFTDQITDVEVEAKNDELESSIDAILRFVRRGGSTFPFIFIDPTGWTGFAMRNIAPLLRLNPGEVLINFMIGHIRRFIESPQDEIRESFTRLLDSHEFKSRIEGLTGQDLDDALVSLYSESVTRTGHFKHISHAIVLHPEKDRTHFDLIYATRHESGIKAFKDAEEKAMAEMELARAAAQKRSRQLKTGQTEFAFATESSSGSAYYESLRRRYLSKARESVRQQLCARQRVPYDDAWILALAEPLIWESDLKEWIRNWVDEGALKIEGLTGKQTVPKLGNNHFLLWLSN